MAEGFQEYTVFIDLIPCSGKIIYSDSKNLVLRARSEMLGYAMVAANRLFRL